MIYVGVRAEISAVWLAIRPTYSFTLSPRHSQRGDNSSRHVQGEQRAIQSIGGRVATYLIMSLGLSLVTIQFFQDSRGLRCP
jgi:hypothetical protein